MTIEERLTAIETDIADIKEAIATLGGGVSLAATTDYATREYVDQ